MASDTHADDAESAVDEMDQTDQVEPIVLPEFDNEPETAKRILAGLRALAS